MSELYCNGHYAFTLLSSAHYTTSTKKPNILDFYFLNSNHKMQTCRPPLECIKRRNIGCISPDSLHHQIELNLLMTKSETLNIEDIQNSLSAHLYWKASIEQSYVDTDMSEQCWYEHDTFILFYSAHSTASTKKPDILGFYFLNSNHNMEKCMPHLE